MNIGGYLKDSINEGLGLRDVVFVSGCTFNCKGCHNKLLQDFSYGIEFTNERQFKVINAIKNNPLHKNITICGGEPLHPNNIDYVMKFLKKARCEIPDLNIWCYTGYKYEDVKNKPILKEIDVLIDGLFIEDLKDVSLQFRGSSNQRLIDVQESLKQNKVVLFNC